ncbi:Type IV pilus biogenesis and competence protein PilQ precursor [Planctopirus ephydatiae]|uniref:Type IV pilus biogenesis and competence protein PilQ n=1 Tax=Planctopirus ephydatiae TaxID=2528019 RepID=A0A518GTY0_9PLAN|nr:secretin and TonB N-terminal domain-containing protein [Planctopirus ephydatiae]QDV32054.1 Type IV pilus biogenesis and competence protein PilQ precursor [Planctopirus ephydatiae]
MPASPFNTAFRAMALGFALPVTLFVGSEFWPSEWKSTPLVRGSTTATRSAAQFPQTDVPPASETRSALETRSTPATTSQRAISLSNVKPSVGQTAAADRLSSPAQSSISRPAQYSRNIPDSRNIPAVPEPHDLPEVDTQDLPVISFHTLPVDEPPLRQPHTGKSSPPGNRQIEAQLSGLERKIEMLAQAQTDRQQSDLERARALYDQMRNSQQLQQIENRLNELSLKSTQAQLTAPATSTQSSAVPVENKSSPETTPTTNPSKDDLLQQTVLPSTATPPEGESLPQIRVMPQIPHGPDGPGGTVTSDEKFDLQVEQAELPRVLELLAQMAGINILTSPEVVGKVTVNLQGVTLEAALDGLLRTRGYLYQREGDIVFVMTAREAEARRLASRKVLTKIYQPNYINVKELQQLVQPILTPTLGKVSITSPSSVGIAENATDAGGDSLSQRDAILVQDYEEVINEIDRVIIEMDIPPLQVIIDAKILSVKLTDDMAFGVNLALLGGDKNLAVTGNGASIATSSGFPGGTGSIIPPGAQFLANTAGLKYGFIAGDITGFIRALESIADTSLVASPQIRALNKQRAEMIIGNRLSYKTLAFNSTQTIENVNFLESGTKLIIRPFIAPDGLVRMEVHPERSRAVINQSTGLPDQDTTEVTTNVMVRDGQTVVIGGLISEESTESIDRVPVLGAIPLVGAAFRNKSSRIERTELIVLITPRIVDEFAAAAEGDILQAATEERAAHFRDHLSPVNRNSLTRAHYERAAFYLQKGELMRARQHIDAALHQNSADLDALQLRNEINTQIEAKTGEMFRWPGRNKKSARQAAAAAITPSPITPTVLLPSTGTTTVSQTTDTWEMPAELPPPPTPAPLPPPVPAPGF